MQTGNFLLATKFDDTFNVDEDDLNNAMEIDGGDGDDTLNVDVNLVFGDAFGQNPAFGTASSGVTNAVVLNVENLNLLDGFNQVGFNAGTDFVNVIGGAFNDLIINPNNLNAGWFLDVMGNGGFVFPFENAIHVTGAVNDLSLGTIQATGGSVHLGINTPFAAFPGNASNTIMKFEQYELFQASIFGIFLVPGSGSTFANTTISFSDQVTGTVLDSSVGNWIFLSPLNDTFTLGSKAQSVDVIGGGSDTAILDIPGAYTGKFSNFLGDDTIRFEANVDISGIKNTASVAGGVTGAGTFDFSDSGIKVSMTLEQHNINGTLLEPTFIGTGGLPGTKQTVVLTTSGTAVGEGGIEQYVLFSGADHFTVAPDSPGFTQSVDISSGGADVLVFGSPFSGKMFGVITDDTYKFVGNADIDQLINSANVVGGNTGAGTFDFNNQGVNVTMTVAQHNGPSMTAPNVANGPAIVFINTGGFLISQTITLTTSGTATGNAGIEQYVLEGGDYVFTVGALGQAVDITNGGDDVVIYGTGVWTGPLTGANSGDTVKFTGDANIVGISPVNMPTGADTANFNNAVISVTMTLEQHNGFNQPFDATGGAQTIVLTTSGTATGDGGIEQYFLANGNDVFFVAPDNGAFKQNVDLGGALGGIDVLVFKNDPLLGGVFSGRMTGVLANDTYRFAAGSGDVNISALKGATDTAGELTGAGTFDFSDANIQVSMTLEQHNINGTGAAPNFIGTTNTQTVVLTTSGTATGNAGIEQYVLSTTGADRFTVGALGQSVNLQSDAFADRVIFGTGAYTGTLSGATGLDVIEFGGNSDISLVKNGANVVGGITGAGTFDFTNVDRSVSMTLAQHNGPGQPFDGITTGTQTITLTTSGTATGSGGVEQYVLASGNDVFTVAPDDVPFVGFKQNVNISSGGADVLVFGSPYSGKMFGVDTDDTYRFIGPADISKLINNTDVVGGVTGAGTFDFTNAAIVVTMTVAQHNGVAPAKFINTVGSQGIKLTTDGVVTGNNGIETYVLGEDGALGGNTFTIGLAGQNVIGGADNDTVIDTFGGSTGLLLGGGNDGAGDTLILMGANTVIDPTSGGFENLTLTIPNATVTMASSTHRDFQLGVTTAPGIGNKITLSDATGALGITGLSQIENYQLGSGALNIFNFNGLHQTGTVTGGLLDFIDVFNATAAQVANATLIDGGFISIIIDVLNISDNAGGLNLNTKTVNIEEYNLLAGSLSLTIGANSAPLQTIRYNVVGGAIFQMGTAALGQEYNGGANADDVTFLNAADNIETFGGDDIVRSQVAGLMTGKLDGGTGTNTLSLVASADLSGLTAGNFANFDDLILTAGGTYSMTGTQYAEFATNSVATGVNTMVIKVTGGDTTGLTTTTFAGIEFYTLNDGAADHSYSIAGSNTVTDLDTAGANTATILNGVANASLTGGAGTSTYTVNVGGSNTGLDIELGANIDSLDVKSGGPNTGTIELGAGANLVTLRDLSDISGVTLKATGGTAALTITGSDVTISAAQHVLFTAGGTFGAGGTDSITIADQATGATKLSLTATQDAVEAYFLDGNANTVDLSVGSTAGGDQYTLNTINLALANGTDVFNVNNGAANVTTAVQDVTHFDTIAGFASGVAGDTLRLTLDTVLQAFNGTYNAILAANLDAAANTIVVIGSASGSLASPTAGPIAAINTILQTFSANDTYDVFATDDARYTLVVNSAAGAAVYEVFSNGAFDIDGAQLIGVLTGVSANDLVSANFS